EYAASYPYLTNQLGLPDKDVATLFDLIRQKTAPGERHDGRGQFYPEAVLSLLSRIDRKFYDRACRRRWRTWAPLLRNSSLPSRASRNRGQPSTLIRSQASSWLASKYYPPRGTEGPGTPRSVLVFSSVSPVSPW